MARRTQVRTIDLDAVSLLAASVCTRPTIAPAGAAQAAPARKRSSADVLAKPAGNKPGRKGGGASGRDEMLSGYLSSLGRIALLSAEDEQVIARRFREAELRCWRSLLAVPEARALVLGHPIWHDADPRTRACCERLRTGPSGDEELGALAVELHEIDEERLVVAEVLRGLQAAHVRGRSGLAEVMAARRKALDLRNQFVRANLRLVVSVARRFHHHRLPLIDLIQEGNLGLIKSVHRFDPERGFRFSTYAHWWIRQAIERAIMNKGAQVRLPVHVFDARREAAKATRDLQASLGREPSIEELASELQAPIEKVLDILRTVPREPMSLDEPVGDGEERLLGEMISDQDAQIPDEHVIRVDEHRWVRRVLTRLSPMEVDIIMRRYGLDADDDETLEEIGRTYNLSRERVRQIQAQGLKKMQKYVEVRSHAG